MPLWSCRISRPGHRPNVAPAHRPVGDGTGFRLPRPNLVALSRRRYLAIPANALFPDHDLWVSISWAELGALPCSMHGPCCALCRTSMYPVRTWVTHDGDMGRGSTPRQMCVLKLLV